MKSLLSPWGGYSLGFDASRLAKTTFDGMASVRRVYKASEKDELCNMLIDS